MARAHPIPSLTILRSKRYPAEIKAETNLRNMTHKRLKTLFEKAYSIRRDCQTEVPTINRFRGRFFVFNSEPDNPEWLVSYDKAVRYDLLLCSRYAYAHVQQMHSKFPPVFHSTKSIERFLEKKRRTSQRAAERKARR